MNLREWTSNDKLFNSYIPENDRIKDDKMSILGICWNNETDVLSIPIVTKESNNITKRFVSQCDASTFDPLGLISPVMLKAKLFLQKLWSTSLDWDDMLSNDLINEWKQIMMEWKQNKCIYFPRLILFNRSADTKYFLITFVDASTKAYSTTVYLKSVSNEYSQVDLIFSKTRLAPLKTITIPRLELMGLYIGFKALTFVEKEIDLPIMKRYIFCDSEIVLNWIKSTKTLETFVENRLKDLRKSDIEFRHIVSNENPSDIGTRGSNIDDLQINSLWYNGPKFLAESEDKWPTSKIVFSTPVYRSVVILPIIPEDNENLVKLIDLSRYSNLMKGCRIFVYILRYLKYRIWRKIFDKPFITSKGEKYGMKLIFEKIKINGLISSEEIEVAKMLLIKQAQFAFHTNTKKFVLILKQLGARIDKQGIIRCCGRFKNSDLDKIKRFPILLQRKDRFTDLLVLYIHNEIKHFGVNHTLCEVRQNYWILKGRSEVKRILRTCGICKKYSATPYPLPIMPPLPKERVCKSRPFQFIGLDYMGPLALTIILKNEAVKIWICLFTCCVTRGIHLEYTLDLSAPTFLNCLRRFISRKGKPDKIISDNASHFKLTAKVLDKVWQDLIDDPSIQYYFSTKSILWVTIVQYAPWQGGFYERLNSLIKSCLRKSIGKKYVNFDSFITLLTEVESIINSRPLTYISDDNDKITILRPIDFLLPHTYVGTPVEARNGDQWYHPRLDTTEKLEQYWKRSMEILDKFWVIWYDEYLANLRERSPFEHKHKKLEAIGEPKIGEVVIIKDDNHPNRGFWKLGKIAELNVGIDGLVRSAEVKLGDKTVIKRPVNNLFPLEINDKPENVNDHSFEYIAFMNTVKLPIFLCFILLLFPVCTCSFNNNTELKYSNDFQCKQNLSEYIYSSYCMKEGVVIYKYNEGNVTKYCHNIKNCSIGHLLNGVCSKDCLCPEWAFKCTKLIKNVSSDNFNTVLDFEKPMICSYVPDKHCSEKQVVESFPQILLENNSFQIVKTLNLINDYLNMKITCKGEGLEYGTPDFCKNHLVCHQNGTKFCYFENEEFFQYVNAKGFIPIKGWGFVSVKYYPPKNNEIANHRNVICENCTVNCATGGLKLFLPIIPDTIKVCSLPFCFEFSSSSLTEHYMVPLPKEIIIKEHDSSIDMWANGKLLKHLYVKCPSSAFCEMIECFFCLENLENPQCYSKSYFILLGVLIYLLLTIVFLLYRFLRIFIRIMCIFKKGFMILFHFMWKCKNYLLSWKRKYKNDKSENYSLLKRTNSSNNFSCTAVSLCTFIYLMCFSKVNGCSESTSFTASSSQCEIDINKTRTCTLNEITKLVMMPQGQEACLLIQTNETDPIGTVSVKVNKLFLECKKKSSIEGGASCVKLSTELTFFATLKVSGRACIDGATSLHLFTQANIRLSMTLILISLIYNSSYVWHLTWLTPSLYLAPKWILYVIACVVLFGASILARAR